MNSLLGSPKEKSTFVDFDLAWARVLKFHGIVGQSLAPIWVYSFLLHRISPGSRFSCSIMRGLSLCWKSSHFFTLNLGFCTVKNSCDTFYQTIRQNRITQYVCIIDGLPKFQSLDLRDWRIRPIYFYCTVDIISNCMESFSVRPVTFEEWSSMSIIYNEKNCLVKHCRNPVHEISSRSSSRAPNWSKPAKQCAYPLRMVRWHSTRGIIAWVLVHVWRISHYRRDRSSRRTTDMLLWHQSVPWQHRCSPLASNRSDRDRFHKIEMETTAQCCTLVWFDTRVKQRIGLLADHQYCDHDIAWLGSGSLSGKGCQKKSWQYRRRDSLWENEENLNKEKVVAQYYKKTSLMQEPGEICQF